jgi:hypothetical protein
MQAEKMTQSRVDTMQAEQMTQSTVDSMQAEQMTQSYNKQNELRGRSKKVKYIVVHLSGVSGRPEIFDVGTTRNSSWSSLPAMGLTWLPTDIMHQAVLIICSLIFVVKWCELVVN